MHSAIQHYLTLAYNESAAEADRFDLETFFEDEFRKTYLEEYKANKDTHFTNAVEMREFFDDGIAIINYFKKKRGNYFSKRGWYLVACELPIVITPNNAFKNVLYKGFIDLVMYHEPTNTFKIYDFKTSTRGWNEDAKKDERKQFQLLFYKKYFGEQYGVPEDNIDVEFMIVKRKVFESDLYVIKRVQIFKPTSGKVKLNRVAKTINSFYLL
jgi:RecB family exonuclease